MQDDMFTRSGGSNGLGPKKYDKNKATYLDRLYELNIADNVIEWINNIINSNDVKIGKINDEHLFVYIFEAHKELNIPLDPYLLASQLHVNLKKSDIDKMLSGTYCISSPLCHLSKTSPIAVIYMENYVSIIIEKLSSKIDIHQDIATLIDRIEIFARNIRKRDRFLTQENPKSMSSAIVFYYCGLIRLNVNRIFFYDNDSEERDFIKCYNKIRNMMDSIIQECNQEIYISLFKD